MTTCARCDYWTLQEICPACGAKMHHAISHEPVRDDWPRTPQRIVSRDALAGYASLESELSPEVNGL